MMFFKIAGVCLLFIAGFNLMDVSVQMAIKEPVYACSEVVKTDPINVQKICNRRIKWN
jgi:hypothetical protein